VLRRNPTMLTGEGGAVAVENSRIPEGTPQSLATAIACEKPLIVRKHPLMAAPAKSMSLLAIGERIGTHKIILQHKHRWVNATTSMMVSDYLSTLNCTDFYWRQVDIRTLGMSPLSLPEPPGLKRRPMYFDHAWIGPSDTVQTFHQDNHNDSFINGNLFMQFGGSKYIAMAPPDVTSFFLGYPLINGYPRHSSVSPFDEKLRAACPEIIHGVLHEGDVVYIPPRYWHFFKSVSPSISISRWWFNNGIAEIVYAIANDHPIASLESLFNREEWLEDLASFGGSRALDRAAQSLHPGQRHAMMWALTRAYGNMGGSNGRFSL
jgi:hypothetical protein